MKTPDKILATRQNIESKQASRLTEREARIEKHLGLMDSFAFEIGKELAGINAEGDYPERSFETYVKRRWNRERNWAYKLIEGFEVRAELPESVSEKIQKTTQALALKAAPKAERAKVISDVAASGPVTAKRISEKIEERKKEQPKDAEFEEITEDANGEAVPKNIASEFQRVERESKDAIQKVQGVKNYLEQDDLTTVEARALREVAKDLLAGLKTHLTKHVLCPKCAGKKCAVCSKRGFVSKHFASKGIGKKED